MTGLPKSIQIDASSDISELQVDQDFLKISTPARIMIAGPTLSGEITYCTLLPGNSPPCFQANRNLS